MRTNSYFETVSPYYILSKKNNWKMVCSIDTTTFTDRFAVTQLSTLTIDKNNNYYSMYDKTAFKLHLNNKKKISTTRSLKHAELHKTASLLRLKRTPQLLGTCDNF